MPCYNEKPYTWYYFPLGLPYISAYLKAKGINVYTLNLNYSYDFKRSIVEALENSKATIVGISVSTCDIKHCIMIADTVKAFNKDILVAIGGGVVSGDPEAAMELFINADVGMIGEGEITTYDICKCWFENESFESIKGIIYRSGKTYIINKKREDIQEISQLPWPDLEGFQYGKYLEINELQGTSKYLPLLTSRSCPFSCSFCFHTCGNTYRQRDIDEVFKELEQRIQNYPVEFISVYDELLTANKKRLREFCDRIAKYNIAWACSVRADFIDDDIISMLKSANCVNATVGVETHSQSVLNSMEKRIELKKIDRALAELYKRNFSIQCNLIFGDPKETLETVIESTEWAYQHPQYFINLAPILTLPGSKIYRQSIAKLDLEKRKEYLATGDYAVNLTNCNYKEYSQMLRRIEKCSFSRKYLPSSMTVNKKSSNSVQVIANCQKCDNAISAQIIVDDIIGVVYCTKCGQYHYFDIDTYFPNSYFSANLLKMTNMRMRIGILGRNRIAYKVLHVMKSIQYKNVYFYINQQRYLNIPLFGYVPQMFSDSRKICDVWIDCMTEDEAKGVDKSGMQLVTIADLVLNDLSDYIF